MRWLLVALVGCWSTTPVPPAAPPPIESTSGGTWRPAHTADRCATVVPRIFVLVRANAANGQMPAAMIDDLETATMEHCHESVWAPEVFDCYDQAADFNAASSCYRMLTDVQREAFEARVRTIVQRHYNSLVPPPPPPPAPNP